MPRKKPAQPLTHRQMIQAVARDKRRKLEAAGYQGRAFERAAFNDMINAILRRQSKTFMKHFIKDYSAYLDEVVTDRIKRCNAKSEAARNAASNQGAQSSPAARPPAVAGKVE